MSQENVETVRRAFEASVRRDNEAALRLYDPEVEIHSALGEVYRGVDGVREYFRGLFGAVPWVDGEVEEWIDAGDEVIAAMHVWGQGRRSAVPVEVREFHVWTVRDGKLALLRIYAHRSEALKAVGLEE